MTFVFTLYTTDLTWNAKQKTWDKTWVTRQLYLFLCVFVSDSSKYLCFLPHQKNFILSFRFTPAIAATGISRSSSAVERLHPSLRLVLWGKSKWWIITAGSNKVKAAFRLQGLTLWHYGTDRFVFTVTSFFSYHNESCSTLLSKNSFGYAGLH